MTTTVHVTVTPDVILRHAVELADPPNLTETVFERQARGVDQLGYAIVRRLDPGEDVTAETARFLTDAFTDAAKARALAEPTADTRGVLGRATVDDLMPDVVAALLRRPDLIAALHTTTPGDPL